MTKKKTICFDSLERTYDISPRNDIKIALGGFNARVGKKAVNFPTNGSHSLTDDNGSRLLEFSVSRSMIIGSIFHPHKDIRKSIWRSDDGVTFKQIIF